MKYVLPLACMCLVSLVFSLLYTVGARWSARAAARRYASRAAAALLDAECIVARAQQQMAETSRVLGVVRTRIAKEVEGK